MENKIDNIIREFAEFINISWSVVFPILKNREYTTDEQSISDWLQCNWEILVERKILKVNQYLEVYGEGADLNGGSSRVTDITSLPNFSIKISSYYRKHILDLLNNEFMEAFNLKFLNLVSFKDGFYQIEPLFNYVLVEDANGIERVFSINDIEFILIEL